MLSKIKNGVLATRPKNHSLIETLEDRKLMSTAFALNDSGQLLRFDTNNPGVIQQRVQVSGLQGRGESLRGIDFRPATGELYLLTIARDSSTSSGSYSGSWNSGRFTRIYSLNTSTGRATQKGMGFSNPSLNGTYSGVDFNPTVDRIRYVNDINQNLRIHPDTGQPVDGNAVQAGVQPDGMLKYAAADRNAGRDPDDNAVAYTNPDRDPNTGTTLYGIDTRQNTLVIQNPPNDGTLNTVGSLNIDAGDQVSFDIGLGNVAFAAVQPGGSSSYGSGSWGGSYSGGSYGDSKLYSINLTTGAATNGRTIGNGERIIGLALALGSTPAPATAPSTTTSSSTYQSGYSSSSTFGSQPIDDGRQRDYTR